MPVQEVAISHCFSFLPFVLAAFSQRRKKIADALKPLFENKYNLFAETGIDPARRPETLSVEEFCRLGNAISVVENF